MKLSLAIGVLLVTVTAAAVAVAVWASVADTPWEDQDDQGSASLLCQDALERRKAVEDALQRPVSSSGTRGDQIEGPLSAFRDHAFFADEIIRLESTLRAIERDIQRFCK